MVNTWGNFHLFINFNHKSSFNFNTFEILKVAQIFRDNPIFRWTQFNDGQRLCQYYGTKTTWPQHTAQYCTSSHRTSVHSISPHPTVHHFKSLHCTVPRYRSLVHFSHTLHLTAPLRTSLHLFGPHCTSLHLFEPH